MSSADADATLGTISGRRVSETQVRRGVAARVVRSDDRGADTRQKKEPRFFGPVLRPQPDEEHRSEPFHS